MIQATLVRRKDGARIAHITVPTETELKPYNNGETKTVEGWLELTAPGKVDQWLLVKRRRNSLLDASAWTVREDSPLSAANKSLWKEYLSTLHRVTVDYKDPDAVEWPEPPELEFA